MWASELMIKLLLTQETFEHKEKQAWGQSEAFSLGHGVFGVPVICSGHVH